MADAIAVDGASVERNSSRPDAPTTAESSAMDRSCHVPKHNSSATSGRACDCLARTSATAVGSRRATGSFPGCVMAGELSIKDAVGPTRSPCGGGTSGRHCRSGSTARPDSCIRPAMSDRAAHRDAARHVQLRLRASAGGGRCALECGSFRICRASAAASRPLPGRRRRSPVPEDCRWSFSWSTIHTSSCPRFQVARMIEGPAWRSACERYPHRPA